MTDCDECKFPILKKVNKHSKKKLCESCYISMEVHEELKEEERRKKIRIRNRKYVKSYGRT